MRNVINGVGELGDDAALIGCDPAPHAAPGRHAACGYVIHAEYPLRALPRCDAAEGPLGRILLRAGAVPEHLDAARLVRINVEVAPGAVLVKPRHAGRALGRILIRGGNEMIVDADPGGERGLESFILGSGLGAIALQNGLLPLHASAVAIGQEAIGFAAPSGAGKSTLAAAIAARGHAHLTDDLAVTQLGAQDPPIVYPGTRTMKLSPASAATLGLDAADAEAVVGGRGKDRFGSTAPDAPATLAALYFPVPHAEEAIAIEPLAGIHAVAAVTRETYRRTWLAPLGIVDARMRDIAQLVRRTPCFRLHLPHRFEMLPATVNAVLEHHRALPRRIS